MKTWQKILLPVLIITAVAPLIGIKRNAEPAITLSVNAPDIAYVAPVSNGNLSVSIWTPHDDSVCKVVISAEAGLDLSNWVKLDGVLPRAALATGIIQRCTGRTAYLSSIEGSSSDQPAVWEESPSAESAVTLARHSVVVTRDRPDTATLLIKLGKFSPPT